MTAATSFQMESNSPEMSAQIAQNLAPLLMPGDCLLLDGPVGAGKSHFARSLILSRLAAAGRVEDVPSPTYTLVQTYADDICELWHADLYRLSNPDEVIELGLDEAFSNAICLIEWPDRLGDFTPTDALHLGISMGKTEGMRVLSFHTTSPRFQRILGELVA